MTDVFYPATEPLERTYRFLSGDDSDERSCGAISEHACTDLPRNYLLNVGNGAATKLAEQLASPGLVLPWLATAIGAPATIGALFLPVKQAGSLMPQLAVAGAIRALARRKWAWVGAGATQAVLLALLGLAALLLPPLAAGVVMLVLFAGFSLASGAGSVAFQDVMGKTVPKGRRGRLLSNRALLGGGLTVAVGAGLRFGMDEAAPLPFAVALVLLAAALWALGAGAFAAINEEPGASGGGRSMLRELGAGLGLVRGVPGYRGFLVARVLLMLGVELAMPFFALHAGARFGTAAALLGTYVVAAGVAQVVASPFWGRWSDVASHRVMAAGGLIAALAGALALAVPRLPGEGLQPWLYALVFVLVGVAEGGLRLGRKTYLVDGAPPEERPLYTAFANTVAGLAALTGGLLGLLADATGPAAAVLVLSLLATAGALAAWRLPEAAAMARPAA